MLIVTVGDDPPGSLSATATVMAPLQLNVGVGEHALADPERVRAPFVVCRESFFGASSYLLTIH